MSVLGTVRDRIMSIPLRGAETRPIFFMHIPKTAGSSVNRLFTESLGPEAVRTHIESAQRSPDLFAKRRFVSGHFRYTEFRRYCDSGDFFVMTLLRDPVDHLRSHLNWVRILTIEERFRTFIETRDALRLVSEKLRDVDVNDADAVRGFLDENADLRPVRALFENCQVRYLLEAPKHDAVTQDDLQLARARLETFDFVGINELFEETIRRLGRRFRIRFVTKTARENVQSYGRDIDRDRFRDLLGDYIGYDCALYDEYRARFLSSLLSILRAMF